MLRWVRKKFSLLSSVSYLLVLFLTSPFSLSLQPWVASTRCRIKYVAVLPPHSTIPVKSPLQQIEAWGLLSWASWISLKVSKGLLVILLPWKLTTFSVLSTTFLPASYDFPFFRSVCSSSEEKLQSFFVSFSFYSERAVKSPVGSLDYRSSWFRKQLFVDGQSNVRSGCNFVLLLFLLIFLFACVFFLYQPTFLLTKCDKWVGSCLKRRR